MASEPQKKDKSIRAEAIFFGLFIGGAIRIVWVYLTDGSLIEALGITLTSLALALLIYWPNVIKRFRQGS